MAHLLADAQLALAWLLALAPGHRDLRMVAVPACVITGSA